MGVQEPNSRERAIWKKARRNREELHLRVRLSVVRLGYARQMANFARKHGINVALAQSSWWEGMTEAVNLEQDLIYKIGVVMDAAERGELAARPTSDGSDLDVVGEDPLPAKWIPFKLATGEIPVGGELGIAPFIVLGIIVAVVIGGILTVTAMSNSYSKKIDRDIELATLEAEKAFCKDPKSAICKAWFKKKKTPPVKQATGALDWLLGAGAGKRVAGGLVALLVVGGGFWLFTRPKKKAAA